MTTGDWERLGRAIEERIASLHLTQADIQRLGGTSPAKVREIVNGRTETLSPSKRRDLERALKWDPGSVDKILDGGTPSVTTYIRDSTGKLLLMTYGGQESGQEGLELLRLATIVADVRDNLRKESTPLHRTLARELDEAAELALRAIAREHYLEGELAEKDIADARALADAARAANNIRRQGDIYVIDNEGDTHVDTTTPTGTPGETREGEKTLGGLGRRLTADADQDEATGDWRAAARDVGGPGEAELIRRQQERDADQGGA